MKLTYQVPVLPPYRNQSIDLLCKSIDWFLHEGNTDTWWVNVLFVVSSLTKIILITKSVVSLFVLLAHVLQIIS